MRWLSSLMPKEKESDKSESRSFYRMTRKIYLPFVLVLILLSASQEVAAQQPDQQPLDSLWINLPSTPLRFFGNQAGNGYTLNNYSIGHVIGYRLGCVSQQGDRYKIHSKRTREAVSLKPMSGSEVHGRSVVMMVGWLPFAPCKKGTLTVIEVQFKDGSVWKIN